MRLLLNIVYTTAFFVIAIVNGYGQLNLNPTDKNATKETISLYRNMQILTDEGIMFGHQDDLAYGLGWKYEEGRSDVKSVTGAYPAVHGWDLGHIELGRTDNLDSVSFDKIKSYIRKVYMMGGVNTISWHLNNPVNGATSWDSSNTVSQIIPGGKYHKKFKTWLDKVAAFLDDLRGPGNEPIPVLFRPYHEHTGNWFWWGQNNCTADDYKALWRFTVNYLRNKKKLHHILFVYSTSRFSSASHYLERYPGDEYIDIVGFDTYLKAKEYDYVSTMENQLAILQDVAKKHHKIAAVTETGNVTIPDEKWWTNTLLPILSRYKLSYFLVWRNARADHYYAPFPGQASAEDFKKLYESSKVIFQDRLKNFRLYQ